MPHNAILTTDINIGILEDTIKVKSFKKIDMQKLIIFCVMVLLFVFFMVLKEGFASYTNIMTIILSTCVNGCLALIGVTFVIITGEIDLSVGTSNDLYSHHERYSAHCLGLAHLVVHHFWVLTGVICGAINGFMVAKMMLPPFIATLAMMMGIKV